MRIVAGTYEGFCYGWESTVKPGVGGVALDSNTDGNSAKDASQPSSSSGSNPHPLSLVFGYNVHVGCIKSVATTTSGTRAGQLLVTGGADERIRIYGLRDRTELGELQQHDGVCVLCIEGEWRRARETERRRESRWQEREMYGGGGYYNSGGNPQFAFSMDVVSEFCDAKVVVTLSCLLCPCMPGRHRPTPQYAA